MSSVGTGQMGLGSIAFFECLINYQSACKQLEYLNISMMVSLKNTAKMQRKYKSGCSKSLVTVKGI